METTRGPLGFNIPRQTQKKSTDLTFTSEAILSWRNHLPMADTGKTANQVFHALNDCNKVTLSPKERFQILELLRTPVQFICQSLRKHYINQTQPLTDTQLTIARLAETLQLEMAYGYKLILEQGSKERSSEFTDTIMPITIERLFHYYDHLLLRSYHLYALPNQEWWDEIHLLFEFAQKNNYLKSPEILSAYKSILLLSITDPYKWRQNEQDTLHDACRIWSTEVALEKSKITSDSKNLTTNEKLNFLTLEKLIQRIKDVIKNLEPNELQAKIAHSAEPEYLVPISVLTTIVDNWEKKTERVSRTKCEIRVEMATGLSACHYYLNDEKPFIQQSTGTTDAPATIALAEAIELTSMPADQASSVSKPFPLYDCTMINENEKGGAGLTWHGNPYPPIQPGEIICLRTKSDQNQSGPFSVAMIRWMKHPEPNKLHLGSQRLAATAKAGAIQIVKEDQNAGYFLRCLIFNNQLVTPILPFKSGSIALLAENSNEKPLKIELKKLIQSTSSYKIFEYILLEKEEKLTTAAIDAIPFTGTSKKEDATEKKSGNDFDSIWSKL